MQLKTPFKKFNSQYIWNSYNAQEYYLSSIREINSAGTWSSPNMKFLSDDSKYELVYLLASLFIYLCGAHNLIRVFHPTPFL
jgi:hypothetical protein